MAEYQTVVEGVLVTYDFDDQVVVEGVLICGTETEEEEGTIIPQVMHLRRLMGVS